MSRNLKEFRRVLAEDRAAPLKVRKCEVVHLELVVGPNAYIHSRLQRIGLRLTHSVLRDHQGAAR